MKTMKPHHLCEMFPLLPKDELQALADDIKLHGQREPIRLLSGKIIDGRNRYEACKLAGVEPIAVEVTEDPNWQDDAVAFVKSLNLLRRHLTDAQRAMFAGEFARIEQGHGKSKGSIEPFKNEPTGPLTITQAAKLLKVSKASVKRAVKIKKHGAKALKQAVQDGDVALSTAAKLSDKPKPEQVALLKKGPEAVQEATAPKSSPTPSAIEIVEACYMAHKQVWNMPPPPTPRQVVDVIVNALRMAG